MPIPLRVPLRYALAKLNESARGFPRLVRVNTSTVEDLVLDGLVQVKLLRQFFNTTPDYMQFKRSIQVPHSDWQRVINQATDPKTQNYAKRQMKVNPSHSASNSPRGSAPASPRASPGRSRSTSPLRKMPRYRKGELNMQTHLRDLSDEDYNATPFSTLSIVPSGDECDDTDVNLPLPACQAVNKVCRNYNRFRQYMPKRPDGSERKKYAIKVKTAFRRRS